MIISGLLARLLIATFVVYDFLSFLTGIRQGYPIVLGLLISIIAVGFVLIHELGIDFTYKEIEQVHQDKN